MLVKAVPVPLAFKYHFTLPVLHVAVKVLLPPLHITLGLALADVGLAGEAFTVTLILTLALVHVPLSHTA